jgi:hypothetical protein
MTPALIRIAMAHDASQYSHTVGSIMVNGAICC